MFWKTISIVIPLVALLAASGCSSLDDPASCPSGLLCPSGTVCAAKQDICIAGPCGNGIIDVRASEVCDDGNIISGDGCSQDCRSDENCGNGVVDAELREVCDDGNRASGDGCSADCSSGETCGNGIVDRGASEVCDDAEDSTDCDADCTPVSCGDGWVNAAAGEQCDPPSQTCSEACKSISCGDGIVEPGEDCDEGGVSTPTCDANCSAVACGDGLVNTTVGEQCDTGGNTVNCDADCTLRTCGDGFLNPAGGEQCDTGGNSSSCDADCTSAVCGDRFFNTAAGEECDDGNSINTDECTSLCKLASCTDGFQNADEIDIDCGGYCGPASCEMLQSCSSSEDCMASGVCLGGTCVPDWSRLVTGSLHTCALLDTGVVRCWGRGESGRLGYANTNYIGDNEIPAAAGSVDVGGSVTQVDAGGSHTCALLNTGVVHCWGDANFGQLGYGDTADIGDNETPALAGNVNVGGSVIQIATGGEHTCALLDTGAVRCWGRGSSGQLGYANTNHIGNYGSPASVGTVNVGGSVVQVATGSVHTCVLLGNGAVRCWGSGSFGKLGYANTSNIGDNEVPASAGSVSIGGSVIQIAAGTYHTCVLLASGTVRCWGRGIFGQLGYANTADIGDNEPPSSAGNVDVGGTVVQIAAGGEHTCALLDTGAVRCWGRGIHGQLGYANTADIGDDELPSSAGNVNVGGTVVQIAAGGEHTCALLDTGTIRCWGKASDGQLGYANTNNIGDTETPTSAGDIIVVENLIAVVSGNLRDLFPTRMNDGVNKKAAQGVLDRRSR